MIRLEWLGLGAVACGCFVVQDFGARPGGAVDGGASDAANDDSDAASHEAGEGDGARDADGPETGGPADTIFVPTAGPVTMVWDDVDATISATRLSHDLFVDVHEVTVGQFRAWLDASAPSPCPGQTCTLDPGGPYANIMRWYPADDPSVATAEYRDTPKCERSSTLAQEAGDAPTYLVGDATLPINCVTFAQAAAICAFRKMRLLTEVEWYWLASGRGQHRKYSSGDTPPSTCADAIVGVGLTDSNSCGFPKPFPAAPGDVSRDAVHDLTGGLREWAWGTPRVGTPPSTLPDDYAGDPRTTSSVPVRGGGFVGRPLDIENRSADSRLGTRSSTQIGFRCARTKLP